MLDGVEANGTASDCLAHGGDYVLDPERLHKPQDLHVLALALFAHPPLQQTAQIRVRREPGGTENAIILSTVFGSIPNRQPASRLLNPI